MSEAMSEYGNPSSLHQAGRQVKSAVESARRELALSLGCEPAEIFFTSGATESLNMALYAALDERKDNVWMSKKVNASMLFFKDWNVNFEVLQK